MRIFAILALVCGVALAGGAVYYMYGQFNAAKAQLQNQPKVKEVPTVLVAVAASDLKFGQPITKDDVKLIKWPEKHAPKNVFNTAEDVFIDADEGETVKTRTVLRKMEKGELILKSKVTGFGEEATVAALLEPGMRAHTMRVDATSSVGGFLLPGARVDVVLTVSSRETGPKTYFLMQNVEIIAVDQDTDRDRIKARIARTITVQVTPESARELVLADTLGKISLTLRGYGAEDVANNEAITRRELLNEPEPIVVAEPEPEPEPEPETKVIVRKGVDLQEVTVD